MNMYAADLSTEQMIMVQNEVSKNAKNPLVAFLLWGFLGFFGAHRFYLGNTGYAVAMLLLGWATFFIWPVLDALFIMKRIREVNAEIEEQAVMKIKAMTK